MAAIRRADADIPRPGAGILAGRIGHEWGGRGGRGMDDWQELRRFMAGHQEDLVKAVQDSPMLRAAWEAAIMMLPGLMVKVMSGDSAALSAQIMGSMGLAYMLGQQASGEKVFAEWLGMEGEEGNRE